MMFRFLFIMTYLYSFYIHADTSIIIDDVSAKPIERLRFWQEQLYTLQQAVVENDRITNCKRGDRQCFNELVGGSEKVYELLLFIVNDWNDISSSTEKILDGFQVLELPSEANKTKQQFKNYLYLLSKFPVEEYERQLLVAYVKGNLGLLNNYNEYYKMNKLLANEALKQKVKLRKIKYKVMKQISEERKILSALVI